MHTFVPSLKENRRQSYVVNRSISVAIWIIGKSKIDVKGLRVFFSILVGSCVMWSGALDSSALLLSHLITSLA